MNHIRPLIIISEMCAILLICNLLYFHSWIVGLFLCLFYGIVVGLAMKRLLFAHTRSFTGIYLGILGALSLFIIIQTSIYYMFAVSYIHIAISLILLPLFIALIPHAHNNRQTKISDDSCAILVWSTTSTMLRGILITSLQLCLVYMLFRSQITGAVISPFEPLGTYFLPLFFITTLCVLIHYSMTTTSPNSFIAIFHCMIATSIAVIIFPLGYGYDPFIHKAAEMHIFNNGVIYPKTPYYIGLYTLIVSAGHLIHPRTIQFLNTFLSPILYAVTIITCSRYALSRLAISTSARLSSILLLIIPYSGFIVTTPQSFANVLFVALLLTSLTNATRDPLPFTYYVLLCLAIVSIHPFTGIPAIVFVCLMFITCKIQPSRIQKFLYGLTIILGSFLLPLVLLVQTNVQSRYTFFMQLVTNIQFPSFPFAGKLVHPNVLTLNILYAFHYLLPFVLICTLIFTLYLFQHHKHLRSIILAYTGMCIVLIMNSAFLASGMNIPLVIDYEQGNYSARAMEIALITLFPLLLLTLHSLVTSLKSCDKTVRYIGLCILTSAFISSVYFSYPRNNPVERSRSYTVSATDFETVRAIESNAAKTPYVVLANQTVSSAAISTFGFSRYLKSPQGEQYFYAIPTGGQLYHSFLDMIYGDPSATRARLIMKTMNVKRLYFVVNDYWWDADRINNLAKKHAQESFIVNKKNHVFVYTSP